MPRERTLHESSTRDALTRLPNRRGLDEYLAQRVALRGMPPMTLMEVRLDKAPPDQGDAVVRAVARTLCAKVRGDDVVARVGGEAFVVGCIGVGPEATPAVAERLRAAVGAIGSSSGGPSGVRCTVRLARGVGLHGRGGDPRMR